MDLLDQVYDPTGLEEYGFGKYDKVDYKVNDEINNRVWLVSGYFYPPVVSLNVYYNILIYDIVYIHIFRIPATKDLQMKDLRLF